MQYVPELLAALKLRVDKSDQAGQYFLTGSQHLTMIKNISETLTGRIVIIRLDPMTPYEMREDPTNWAQLILEDPNLLLTRFKGVLPPPDLYETLWRGGYPGLIGKSELNVQKLLASYVTTYIERDVRIVENIDDLASYERFYRLCAALTAQEINHSELGRDIQISPPTAKRWLQVLNYTYQWREVWPYSGNHIKRASKKRKGYITDTGMACYLLRIGTPFALLSHPMLGALFETMCVNLIFQLLGPLGFSVNTYHWRIPSGAEVDLILEQNDILYPIEFKCRSWVKQSDALGIKTFRETYPHRRIAPGVIVYAGREASRVDQDTIALPWNATMYPN